MLCRSLCYFPVVLRLFPYFILSAEGLFVFGEDQFPQRKVSFARGRFIYVWRDLVLLAECLFGYREALCLERVILIKEGLFMFTEG